MFIDFHWQPRLENAGPS